MNIAEFRSKFPDEYACRRYLELTVWAKGRTCPHCHSQKSWTLSGPSVRTGLYECATCHRQFTVTTGTPLHATKLPLKTWLLAMYFMVNSSKGVSSVFLAKYLGVTQKTAWKVGHAVRALMQSHTDAAGRLDGIVELDEKYLGGKPRFSPGTTHPRGKGTKKTCVHVAVNRDGQVRTAIVSGDSYAELAPRVAKVVKPVAMIMTDQLPAYRTIGKNYAEHESVNHGSKEYARGDVHVNTAESFNALLERAKFGVFHFISRRHTKRYVGEIAFRWNNREPHEKVTQTGLFKIIMKAKPVLQLLGTLLENAVGIQLRRSIYGGIVIPQPLFGG